MCLRNSDATYDNPQWERDYKAWKDRLKLVLYCSVIFLWRCQQNLDICILNAGFFFFLIYNFIFCIWGFCLHVCLCPICMPCAGGSKKMVVDPLGLGLHRLLRHHVGAGNQTHILEKSSQCFQSPNHLSAQS